ARRIARPVLTEDALARAQAVGGHVARVPVERVLAGAIVRRRVASAALDRSADRRSEHAQRSALERSALRGEAPEEQAALLVDDVARLDAEVVGDESGRAGGEDRRRATLAVD